MRGFALEHQRLEGHPVAHMGKGGAVEVKTQCVFRTTGGLRQPQKPGFWINETADQPGETRIFPCAQ